MDNRLALMTGIDFPLSDCALIVHQPTIKELSYIGETDFFMGIQLLCVNKSMYETEEVDLSKVTNFDIFMQLMDQPELKGQRELVKQALNMLFPKYQILITPRSIFLNLFNSNQGKYYVYSKAGNRLSTLVEIRQEKQLESYRKLEKKLRPKKLEKVIQEVCLVSIFQCLQLVQVLCL